MLRPRLLTVLLAAAFTGVVPTANAAVTLIASGTLSGAMSDLSGLNYSLENGISASLLGGMGSGLAWAGGNTFLTLPDRGPNASPWNSAVDDTTSYIARFQTVQMSLTANPAGSALPYSLTPTLQATTLLSSATTLNYGPVAPTLNGIVSSASLTGSNYFSGRSDNFAAGLSSNAANARLDPESIRVSNDGKSVFISDEYGPYVYQFDRSTGQRTRSFTLPDNLAINNLSPRVAAEIAGNTSGRVTNKGMEGLAITPDGKSLVGFMQSPLIQDGGDGGQYNRIVKIDIASGAVSQFAYNNQINGKNYNSSEILALNDHQFLVLERDGKGLGDGSPGSKAVVKQVYEVDLTGATDVSNLSGAAALAPLALNKSLFLDIKAALNAKGVSDAEIPSKIEGMSFGQDVMVDGKLQHTLYIANDNDFLGAIAPNGSSTAAQYNNQFYVFAFDSSGLVLQDISPVPEPASYALMFAGLGVITWVARRRRV